jgi:subtilisin family serine protease
MNLFSNQSSLQSSHLSRRISAWLAVLSALSVPTLSLCADSVLSASTDVELAVPGANLSHKGYVADEVIIKFKEHVSLTQQQQLLDAIGLGGKQSMGQGQLLGLHEKTALDVEAALATLQASGDVEYAQPNYTYTAISTVPASNDPELVRQWNLDSIAATAAWGEESGTPVIVAVIDAGIDYTHPDLAANMWVNTGEIPDDGIDNDNNGFIDDVYGYDFAEDSTDGEPGEDGDPMDDEDAMHGTAVAGVIAAVRDNSNQIAGVTSKVRIMALRVRITTRQ